MGHRVIERMPVGQANRREKNINFANNRLGRAKTRSCLNLNVFLHCSVGWVMLCCWSSSDNTCVRVCVCATVLTRARTQKYTYEFVVNILCMQPSIRFAGTFHRRRDETYFFFASLDRATSERKKKRFSDQQQRRQGVRQNRKQKDKMHEPSQIMVGIESIVCGARTNSIFFNSTARAHTHTHSRDTRMRMRATNNGLRNEGTRGKVRV